MKKYFTLFFALFGVGTMVYGQKYKTYSDNFESFSNGDWLAQNSSVWTTWSGTPSTSGDDVKVTNKDSYSGSNSIYFGSGPGPSDIVLPFGGLHNRGQHMFRAMLKIPKSKTFYFNFQGGASVNITWAVEVTFKTDSTITFSNLTSGTMFTTSYPQNRWFEMKMYVNLTRNEWHVFVDGEERGSFSNSINLISFLDMYSIDGNTSCYVDDVKFEFAGPRKDNAGIEEMSSPVSPVCGKNDLKVRVVNNGINALDSVRVYWMLDGKMQKPVFVKSTIDTSYSKAGYYMDVTLDSVLNLTKGWHNLKAWTAYPNGQVDKVNFDDTLNVDFKAEIRGVGIEYASPFMGNKGKGTAAWPDTICVNDTATYGVTPPSGYKSTELGKTWFINYVKISNGNAPKDTMTLRPNKNANFRLRYRADSSEEKTVFKVSISVSVGKGGCDTTLTHYFYIEPAPHAAFVTNDVCLGKLMNFTNKTKSSKGTKYLWKFGDKSSSTFQNSSNLYKNAGKYTVTLTATTDLGCRATASKEVTVFDAPIARFMTANVCDSQMVMFRDSSTSVLDSITEYMWDFGDNDTSGRKNTSHMYAKPGTYKVRLFVTSKHGCTDKTNADVEIYPAPMAAISGMGACQPDTIAFTNNTTYSGSDALSYQWAFGDGNTSMDENPSHLFTSAGNYMVKMYVMSTNGCKDSADISVDIYPMPMADFSLKNGCLGDSTSLMNMSTVSSGSIATYNWSFGNGKKSSKANPVHLYAKPGMYTVELIIATDNGCMDTTSNEVEIYTLPKANFGAGNVCKDNETTFENKSTSDSDTLMYMWYFGDGNSLDDAMPTHLYANDGKYTVKIVVTTENGCMDSTENEVEVYALPDASFTFVDHGFAEFSFTPTDNALSTYKWYFGDGDSSVKTSPDHKYTSEGEYDVTLRTTDDNECMAEMTDKITVSTGIADVSRKVSPLKVFPNPFNEEVNLTYELPASSDVIIEVYSLNGQRLVTLVNHKQEAGKYQYKYKTPDASGIYMVRMVIDNEVYQERIVKTE